MLESIRARALDIAFKAAFAHAAAARAATQTVWVEARDAGGLTGCGEGCPREYVTGETLESALAFVARGAADWTQRIVDIATLRSWVASHRHEIDAQPSAWAAVELALLDLLGKRAQHSVEQILGLPALAGRFRYTAVIGDAARPRFEAELARYLQAGFRDFKIKLSADVRRDRDKVAVLRAAGVAADAVRADANNLWQDAAAAIAFLVDLDYPFMAIEEPLRAGDYAGMAAIAAARGCAVILDESLLRVQQLDALDAGTPWMVNLRISKMGGVLRALALADALRQAGLRMVIGAHVGETSLLTRAALTVASTNRDLLYAQEGAFGTHLLERDIVDPPLMFGAGGALDAAAVPPGAGWGLGTPSP
jgi:L-alanine-DL-glutamate epimerase-like enolase superfamily enzyme